MADVLIIDDDQLICEVLASFVRSMGHRASYSLTLKEGIKKAASEPYDLVFLDVRFPHGNGLTAVPEIRKMPSGPEIIIITGEGSRHGAKMAMENGCWDYIEKPLSIETIKLPFLRAIQYRKEKTIPKHPLVLKREGLIGNSQPLKDCLNLVAKAGETEANVLITGDTGTGKELFASAVHENSRRADQVFVVVDCGTLPENLVESTLFGHVKGAFTGADRDRDGLIKEADGGTLFLDEVGDLPLRIQATFLRVLQEHRFRPVGQRREIVSDFRLVAATNKNLDHLVETGRFRNDLLFRLKTLVIHLPTLKDRSNDILELTLHYLRKFCDRYRIGIKGLSSDFCEALMAYDWPGNVRELIHAVEWAISVARDEQTLYPVHLPTDIRSKLKMAAISFKPPPNGVSEKKTQPPTSFPNLQALIQTTEKQYFEDLMAFTGGDIKSVCRISGLSRANVYARLKKYQIVRHP
jgi:DNA-binding NtrC family response regulator